jgi:hypothetical protein
VESREWTVRIRLGPGGTSAFTLRATARQGGERYAEIADGLFWGREPPSLRSFDSLIATARHSGKHGRHRVRECQTRPSAGRHGKAGRLCWEMYR